MRWRTCLLLVSLVLLASPICKAQGEDEGSLQWYVWLILATALVIGLILIGLTIFYIANACRRACATPDEEEEKADPLKKKNAKRGSKKKKKDGPANDMELGELTDDPRIMKFKKINSREIGREKIRLQQQLGIGEFGPIYDAVVQLERNVKSRALVKIFQKGTSQDLVLFRQELEDLAMVSNAHVARLLGVVSSAPYYAVYELPVNGDLKMFLVSLKNSNTQVDCAQLLAMATDVAAGLAHLESIEYIHRDIATRNCVITSSLSVKVSDYKVGRYLFRSEYAVQNDGSLVPVRWMAPESLVRNEFTVRSAVWSFGVLLWEILTVGEFPFSELTDGEVVHRVCYEFQRLLKPIECPENIYQMMLKCWETDPAKRPKMAGNHQQLESSILSSLPSLEAVDDSEVLPRNEHWPTATGSTNLQEENSHVTSSDMY